MAAAADDAVDADCVDLDLMMVRWRARMVVPMSLHLSSPLLVNNNTLPWYCCLPYTPLACSPLAQALGPVGM